MACLYRERCPMIIKEEPVSPAVHRWSEDVSCGACTEPPVLPLAMVQSVLEGRGSGSAERRAKRTVDRLVQWINTFELNNYIFLCMI